ncbi:MAG: hypothetical protein ACLPXB_11950 [Thiobacillaceae bacterium]
MKRILLRGSAIAFVIGLSTVPLSGCVVPGGGYGYDNGGGVDIGVDYTEPYGAVYGGWGPGYAVGPVRGGNYSPERGGGQPAQHAYRSAPASHSMPSIPTGSRSGGSRRR